MFLKSTSLINFKNFDQAELSFSTKINCFVGNNGVGKTNLLDSIFYLSFCKSFLNPIDSQNIRFEQDFFVIQAIFDKKNDEENIYCGLKRSKKKQFKRNNKEYQRLSDHIGFIPLVMISAYDANLISDGSEERRKFINTVISQYDKKYLENLINYKKILLQRNKLLKYLPIGSKSDYDTLEIYNQQMIPLGESIQLRRKEFIKELIPIFQRYYNFISDGKEEIGLTYKSQLNDGNFSDLLKSSIEKDKVLQYTTTGIHKDDLLLELDQRLIKKIGSQGQQKTFLISLKFAQFDFMKELYGYKPILLLDDVFDKLDKLRVQKILQMVAENKFGQIFITDTNRDRIKSILGEIDIDYKIFTLENGEISE